MEIKVCKKCKRLFNYVAGECFCMDCLEYVDKAFKRVNRYVTEHNEVSMDEASTDCNVPLVQVQTWIHEEKLHTVDEEKIYSTCEKCGKSIPSGNFCVLCKNEIIGEMKNAFEAEKVTLPVKSSRKRKSAQMRFLNK